MVFSIMLSNARKISEFVAIANNFDCDVKIVSDKYKVNAKSIMGMMTLSLNEKLTVEVSDEMASDFEREIEGFLVK